MSNNILPPPLPPIKGKTYVLTQLNLAEQSVKVVYISNAFNDIIIKLHDELKSHSTSEEKDYEHYTKIQNMSRKVEVYKREPGMIYGKTKELEYIYQICEYNI